jgi:long-subunit fatty acid transport protein
MRLKTTTALALAAAMLPLMAQADNLSYSYVDVAYVSTDLDDFDEEIDGFALRGSVEVTEQAFVFGGYTDQSTTLFGEDLDVRSYELGLGYAWPVSDTADFYGKIGYVQAEAEFAGITVDDDGFSLGAGLRGRVAEQFELEGAVTYTDLSDSGDDTVLGLGARWYFTDAFNLGVEADIGNDATTYGVGGRFNFGL